MTKEELERKLEQTEKDLTDYQFNYPKIKDLEKENAELKEKLNRYKHDCPSCIAFGKYCPHKVKGDPYFYDCYLTVIELEKANTELRYQLNKNPCVRIPEWHCSDCLKENATLKKQLEALSGDIPWNKLKDVSELTKKLIEAKEIIKDLLTLPFANNWEVYADVTSHLDRAEQFLNNEVEK